MCVWCCCGCARVVYGLCLGVLKEQTLHTMSMDFVLQVLLECRDNVVGQKVEAGHRLPEQRQGLCMCCVRFAIDCYCALLCVDVMMLIVRVSGWWLRGWCVLRVVSCVRVVGCC